MFGRKTPTQYPQTESPAPVPSSRPPEGRCQSDRRITIAGGAYFRCGSLEIVAEGTAELQKILADVVRYRAWLVHFDFKGTDR